MTSAPTQTMKHDGRTYSIITGASGYLGKEIVHTLLRSDQNKHNIICCLVRASKVPQEKAYWKNYCQQTNTMESTETTKSITPRIQVIPYDMLDDGKSLRSVLNAIRSLHQKEKGVAKTPPFICVHHVASTFGPTEDHVQTALDNVRGTEDVVKELTRFASEQNEQNDSWPVGLVFTSSMAAVRATGQAPKNGVCYTFEDWNTVSKLGDNWGASYQWSKAKSESRAWELVDEFTQQTTHSPPVIDLTTLCPSFIFGPLTEGTTSSSYSIELVDNWMQGKGEVQSRLYVDVRDVAKAHVAAAHAAARRCRPDYDVEREGSRERRRYIVSTEARLSSQRTAELLQEAIRRHQSPASKKGKSGFDADAIYCDETFTGGSIPIGAQEVEAKRRLKEELGVTCRTAEETLLEMCDSLLQQLDG